MDIFRLYTNISCSQALFNDGLFILMFCLNGHLAEHVLLLILSHRLCGTYFTRQIKAWPGAVIDLVHILYVRIVARVYVCLRIPT